MCKKKWRNAIGAQFSSFGPDEAFSAQETPHHERLHDLDQVPRCRRQRKGVGMHSQSHQREKSFKGWLGRQAFGALQLVATVGGRETFCLLSPL